MTHDDDPDKARIRGAFNLAAAHFDDPELTFWTRFGARTVELLDPRPGWRVLDVGCGTGSSALPAARRRASHRSRRETPSRSGARGLSWPRRAS